MAGSKCAEVGKRQRWISAELEFVQSRLAATIAYARSAELLSLLMPVSKGNTVSTVREHALAIRYPYCDRTRRHQAQSQAI